MANVMITRQGYGEPETIPFYQNELPDDAPIGAISVVTDSPVDNPRIYITGNDVMEYTYDYQILTQNMVEVYRLPRAISTHGFINTAIKAIRSSGKNVRFYIKSSSGRWIKNIRYLINGKYDAEPICTSMQANGRTIRGNDISGTDTTDDQYILTRTNTSGSYISALYTYDAINITEYDKLTITDISASSIPTNTSQGLVLFALPEECGKKYLKAIQFGSVRENSKNTQVNSAEINNLTLDISELKGTHYLGVVQSNCLNATFKSLYLE